MKIDDKNTAGCDYIHRMARSQTHTWILIASCVLIAGCVVATAYMLYSQQATRARLAARMTALLEDGQQSVQDTYKNVHDSMSNSMRNLMPEKAEPTGDDAGTVASGSSSDYEGAKMETGKPKKKNIV